MRVIPHQEGLRFVSEMAQPQHIASPSLDAYKGEHPHAGEIVVVLSVAGDCLILRHAVGE